jgi:predicted nucleic-acid-binding Zn-ribbon protein
MKQICPKCGSTKFQLVDIDIDIENCQYGFTSISCKACGYSIGITNYENVPATTIKYGKEILDKLNRMELALKEISKTK